MAVILTVVNQINTGGEGNMALGFTLDALLKLNEVRAEAIVVARRCALLLTCPSETFS